VRLGWEVVVSNTVPYRELEKLIIANGWSFSRIAGSHFIWEMKGRANFVVPVHKGQVKRGWIKELNDATAGRRNEDILLARLAAERKGKGSQGVKGRD
jgi:predicted RNA binding protein YcfA (HicA-like mRNA interferase family)